MTDLSRLKNFSASNAGRWTAAAALLGAASAAWVGSRARRAERLHQPMGRLIEVDGVRLHVVERGQGQPVVLIHGNAVSVDDFAVSGLIDRLAANHRVIAFDRPGFGHSSRPRDRLWTPRAQAALLHAALQQIGVDEPATVVGHSMGTMVAVAMALDFPAAVGGLVLMGGYFYPTARVDAWLVAPVALPVVGDAMRYTVTAWSARAMIGGTVKAMFAPTRVPADFLAVLSREMLVRPLQLKANAEDAAFMIPAARHNSKRHPELTLPVTLMAGDGDKVVDHEAHTIRLHEELLQSRLIIVPGSGHMVHHAAPGQVVDAVAAVAATAAAAVFSPTKAVAPAQGLVATL